MHGVQCSWPIGGEIDIIEGANLQTETITTLHTRPGCAMNPDCPRFPEMTGKFHPTNRNCDTEANGNSGCSVKSGIPYGEPLNAMGGGVFVMEWRELKISAWFFKHGEEPDNYLAGHPDPSTWGAPYAAFPLENNCASTHFEDLQLVFDNTFCGQYRPVLPSRLVFMHVCDVCVTHLLTRRRIRTWTLVNLNGQGLILLQ